MAQTRNPGAGNASKAPKSVPVGERASAEEHAHLMAFMRSKQAVTVKARVGVRAQGWAPGDDMGETAECVSIPEGGVCRVIRTEGPAQDASVLALMVATGRVEILDDKDFAKADSWEKVEAEWNKERARRQSAEEAVGHDGRLAGALARIEELEKQVAAKA